MENLRRRETVCAVMSMTTAVEALTSVSFKRRGSLEEVSTDLNSSQLKPEETSASKKTNLKMSFKNFKKKKEVKDPKSYKLLIEKGDLSTQKLLKFKTSLSNSTENFRILLEDGTIIKFLIRTINTIISNKSNINIEKVVASLECLYVIALNPSGIPVVEPIVIIKQLFEAFITGIPDIVDALSRIFSVLCKSSAENHDKITQVLLELSKKKKEPILNPFATMIKLLSQNYDKQLASVIGLINEYLINISNVDYRISCENELLNEIGLLPIITDLKNRGSIQVLNQIEKLQDLIVNDYKQTLVEGTSIEDENYQEGYNEEYANEEYPVEEYANEEYPAEEYANEDYQNQYEEGYDYNEEGYDQNQYVEEGGNYQEEGEEIKEEVVNYQEENYQENYNEEYANEEYLAEDQTQHEEGYEEGGNYQEEGNYNNEEYYEGENDHEHYKNNPHEITKEAEVELTEDNFCVLLYFGLDKGYQYCNYTSETIIKDLKLHFYRLQESLKLTHSFNSLEFGLFVDNESNNFTSENGESGFWLEDQLTCGDYNFYGRINATYKLKTWNLLINIPSINDELLAADLEADPHSTITEVISTVVSAFGFDQSEEYQLFYHQLDLYLDPTALLLTYPVDEKSTFSLKLKRPPLNINFKEKNFSLDFDYNSTIGALQNEICHKMGIPNEQREFYGIFVDSPLIEPNLDPAPDLNLLEESLVINSLWQLYSDNFSLHFSRKPDWLYVYVVYPPPDPPMQIDIRVFLDRPVYDGLMIVCKHLQINPDIHQLYIQTDDGKNIPLSSEKTFMQQRILPEQQLIIAGKTEQADEKDLTIWEEERNPQTIHSKEEGDRTVVLCGTINQLVRQLTDENKYDSGFINTFLSTYRSFSTPTQLLEKLLQRYYVPDHVSSEEKKVIQMRVCVVLKLWVEKFNDDSEKSLFDKLISFIEHEEKTGPATVKGIKSAITKKKEGEPQYYFNEPPPLPRVPKIQSSNTINDLLLLDIDPLEIARQLTKIEFEMFAKITPVELFGQAWSNAKKQHLCPNLLNLINHFNYISRWVGSSIVSEKKIKQRSRIFNHMILIAENLKNISSFNLLTAMISGLNGSSIGRLSYTKTRLPKRSIQVLESLERLTNMENSYKNYRTAISSIQPPLIPYIGVYLQDLTFIEDGNPDYIDGLINFTKRSLVYKILKQIEVFQLEAYNFVTVPLLRAYLMNLPQINDKDLYAQSLLIEPRNAKRSEIE